MPKLSELVLREAEAQARRNPSRAVAWVETTVETLGVSWA